MKKPLKHKPLLVTEHNSTKALDATALKHVIGGLNPQPLPPEPPPESHSMM